MTINYLQGRYHLSGIIDKPTQPQKAGMGGHCFIWGSLMKKIHVAIPYTDEREKNFFFNRKSSIKYVNRHGEALPLSAQATEIQAALNRLKKTREVEIQHLLVPLENEFYHGDIEQIVFFYCNDSSKRQQIFLFFRQSAEKMEQFLESLGRSLNPAMADTIFNSLISLGMTDREILFLYTH